MNYIKRLEQQARMRAAVIRNVEGEIAAFRQHLLIPKFNGYDESDGTRRDWIAVTDVQRWLDNIASALTGGAE